jgi:hypothetical protein
VEGVVRYATPGKGLRTPARLWTGGSDREAQKRVAERFPLEKFLRDFPKSVQAAQLEWRMRKP